ncbi:MAG TPA: hypothetical protein VK155_06880 [Bacteroidales bacterium]|jgi:hypothetical protein|nr:hypothetical protein [Bacteroidales bacterium]
MDFNATIDLIIRELEEAREIIDDLKKSPGSPLIQIELAKSKCRNAAEAIAMLKQIHESQIHHESPAPQAEKKAEHKQSPAEHDKKHDHPEPAIDENAIAEQKPEKPFVAPIIADTFSHLANRFNEQVGENQGDEFSYTHGRHYEKLSEAIGINDRFYYIREIFDGKREVYNEAVARLEKAQNMKEAREIIADYKTERTSNEAVKQLLDLTKRNFGMHE